MGNWDAAVNRNFKRDAEGRAVFFPLSFFGPGRAVTPEGEAALKKFLGAFQWVVLPFTCLFLFMDLRYIWYLLGGYYGLFFAGELYLLRGSMPSELRLSYTHYVEGTACHAGFAGLWFLAVSCSLLGAVCLYVLALRDMDVSNRLLGLLGGGVFGFYALTSAWALFFKYTACRK